MKATVRVMFLVSVCWIGCGKAADEPVPQPAPVDTGRGQTSDTPDPAGPVVSAPELADLDVLVSYEGGEVGQLVVAAFPTPEPMGPPVSFWIESNPDWPATSVVLEDLEVGREWFVIAFVDTEPRNPQAPDESDPMATSAAVRVEAGEFNALVLAIEQEAL